MGSGNDINLKVTFNPEKIAKDIQQQALDVSTDEFLKAVDDLQRNSPVGVSGKLGNASLKESWDLEIDIINGEVVARVINTSAASLNRLEGRKAGRFPPPEPIQDWVRLKLNVPFEKVKSVAYLIARKIARSGTERRKRNFKEFNPETGAAAPNGAVKRAQQRIVTRLSKMNLNK